MNKKTQVFGLLFCGISFCGIAQQAIDTTNVETLDEIVITDSKFNLKRENSGKVITKITQQQLQQMQGKSIADIINNTVGVEINGTRSHAGQNLNYYIRGGRNRQVLILIDGIALTDASQIANDYDLRLLNADQVESIEILKGASSTLYGSGASTAVINIKLKEASKETIKASFRTVLGSNQSQNDKDYAIEDFRNSVSLNGTVKGLSYLASFGHQFTNGLSSISNGTESDAFNSINGHLKLGYKFSNAFKMMAYASFDKFKSDFDDAFAFVDTDDNSKSNQYRIGIAPEFHYKNGNITLNAAYNNIERQVQSSYPTKFYAESFVGDVFNRYNFNDQFYTVLGVNAQRNEMESFDIPFESTEFAQSINPDDAIFTMVDPYANVVYASKFGLQVNAGLRLNNHSEYGSHMVYSLNPSFKKETNFGYIKGLTSFATAYITPSLYQLFEPTYGNADLKPEENTTFEIGAELHLKDKATFNVVYFTRDAKHFIDFIDLGGFNFQYTNVDHEFTVSGVEVTANYQLTKALRLAANGTYTNADESQSLRIPEIKVNAQLDYKLSDETFMSLSYQYNDDRTDTFYNAETFTNDILTLKNYSLLDFYVSHQVIANKLSIFANVTNILNEDFQEIIGFSTRGRNASLGMLLDL